MVVCFEAAKIGDRNAIDCWSIVIYIDPDSATHLLFVQGTKRKIFFYQGIDIAGKKPNPFVLFEICR